MDTYLTIRQAADRLEISPHTLRYYEREGLLGSEVDRNVSGHRRYTERSLLWVKLLLCLRQTGMSLADIKTFAELSHYGSETVADRLTILQQHEQTLNRHIRDLQNAQLKLQDKIKHYKTMLKDEKIAQKLAHTMHANK